MTNIVVYKGGKYVECSDTDAVYFANDPDWLMAIPINELKLGGNEGLLDRLTRMEEAFRRLELAMLNINTVVNSCLNPYVKIEAENQTNIANLTQKPEPKTQV